jgi:hypothetical protein
MNRRHRFLAALFALFALLASQFAVSAYVCEMMASPGMAVQVDRSLAAEGPDPCPGMLDSANLCEQHCGYGHSAVDQGKPFPMLDVGMAAALRIDRPYVSDSLLRRSQRAPVVPPEPPPAIRFSVLRI